MPEPRSFYDVDDESNKQDVGSQPGTSWTLSSFKPGSGVAELRSRDMSKLWQSDGVQPHLITITFSRLTRVTHVSVYLDVRQDDSYTPTKLCIKAGTHFHDLMTVRTRTFESPQGWKHFLLDKTDLHVPEEEEHIADAQRGPRKREGIACWSLQVCVLANHLNGKDTHVRRCVVWGPKGEDQERTKKTWRGIRQAEMVVARTLQGQGAQEQEEAQGEVEDVLFASEQGPQRQRQRRTQTADQRSAVRLQDVLAHAQASQRSHTGSGLDRLSNLR
ncbi:hypothetical protein ACQY0O_007607 [Thecaphora frezii]